MSLIIIMAFNAHFALGQDNIIDKYSSVSKIKPGFYLVTDASSSNTTKYGIVDFEGNVLLAPSYDKITPIDSTYTFVEKEGKCGIVNYNYIPVVPCQFTSVGSFNDKGIVWVNIDGKYGAFNNQGDAIIPPRYKQIGTFTDNQEGSYKYINTEKLSKMDMSVSDMIVISEDGNYSYDGIMNGKGDVLLPPGQFEKCYAPVSGIIPVSKTEGGSMQFGQYLIANHSLTSEGWVSYRAKINPIDTQAATIPEMSKVPMATPVQKQNSIQSKSSKKQRPSIPSTRQTPFYLPQ